MGAAKSASGRSMVPASEPLLSNRGVVGMVLYAFLTTMMAGVLMLKAFEARTKDYRRTEMWLYLEKDQRPPASYAQWASATVLRETYLTFALWTSTISIGMWVVALVFGIAGL